MTSTVSQYFAVGQHPAACSVFGFIPWIRDFGGGALQKMLPTRNSECEKHLKGTEIPEYL